MDGGRFRGNLDVTRVVPDFESDGVIAEMGAEDGVELLGGFDSARGMEL